MIKSDGVFFFFFSDGLGKFQLTVLVAGLWSEREIQRFEPPVSTGDWLFVAGLGSSDFKDECWFWGSYVMRRLCILDLVSSKVSD